METKESLLFAVFGWALFVVFVIGSLWGINFGWKHYKLWSRAMDGQAELAEAEWTKKVAVEEAKAKQESAVYQAQAEVERAKGVAEANRIIADGLGGADGYLRYLYIDTLKDLNTSIIYVPTEAGLPILEAGKR